MHQEVVVDWDLTARPPIGRPWEAIDESPAERPWFWSATLQGIGLVVFAAVLAWLSQLEALHWAGQETAKKILIDRGAELVLLGIGMARGVYGRWRLGGLK